ncbi:MAG: ABC transporter permease [Sphingobacteriaceae bacterium]
MLKTYFKFAWRSLSKSKIYNAINILGLAAGLSSFIIILLYLNYELSYDKWNPELSKAHRVSMVSNGDILPQTPAPLANFLADQVKEISAATSIQPYDDYEVLLDAGGKKIYQKGMVEVDSSFLQVFPYHLLVGNPNTALNSPNSVVISQNLSDKLFGSNNPIGQSVKIFNSFDVTVTGIMEKPSSPSHLYAELLVRVPYEKPNKHWSNVSYQTYIKLKTDVEPAQLESQLNKAYYNDQLKKDVRSFEDYKKAGQQIILYTDAVPDIHNFPKYGQTNIKTVSVLLVLAILLLVAGAINFSNLSIAKSIGRAKEVGIRKVLGSGKFQLIYQFMTEIGLQCLISLLIAILVIAGSLPYINQSFQINLNFWQQGQPAWLIAQISLCLFLVILLSGLYPSVFLTRFNTSKVLRGDYSTGEKGRLFRNSLIVVQFMVTGFFISVVLIINSQMNYLQSKDKGFSDQQVMRIQATQKSREDGFTLVKTTLNNIQGVVSVAKTTQVPADNTLDTTTYSFKLAAKAYRMSSVKVSTDYFKTLQIPLVKGRLFNDTYSDQNTRAAIINETAAKRLNVGDPIGKNITFANCDSVPMQIVGIVKDFNTLGFETAMQPVVYTIENKACMYQSGGAILLKLNSSNMQQSVTAIEQAWKSIEPDFPLRYAFIDDNFQKLFSSYLRLQKVIAFFAGIAIIIAVMGLFSLTAFFARQRSKEISIRKVLGATVFNLTALLSREFLILVLISVVVISPVAWWAMQHWLQTFTYRIQISVGYFIASGMLVILIALCTVSFQAIKAAIANPAKRLRSE